MSFKIIALEILDSCDSKHSKNLIKNHPYIFYNNYKINRENGNETIELVSEDFDLYSKDSELKINISAIVGKNGSGKSTLVELLIKAINNLFYKYRQQYPDRKFHPVDNVKGIEVNIYYKINTGVFKLYVYSEKGECKYKGYKYSFNESSNEYKDIQETTSSFSLGDFFYTEVINYSLYAYNSKQEGEWITKVFHKNDAYQTPVVLNPWRNEGIININTENDLVYQRLLANLLRYDADKKLNLSLGDNLEASLLILKLSDSGYYEKKAIEDFEVDLSKFDDNFRKEIVDLLFDEFYGKVPEITIEQRLIDLSKLYVLYKLVSICHKYEEYKDDRYFDRKEGRFIDLKELAEKLKKDNSHITFKLRQTLNYLVHQHIQFDIKRSENEVSFKDIASEINNLINTEKYNIINCLPPPIFRIDIQLNSIQSNDREIKFSTLSSGEKQQIYSTNSIYYHLMNLDSVKNSTDDEKISYRNINVILEEIELYFHPEFQRTYLNRLITGIKNLNLNNIEAINIIFVTHSPFILSDIPNSSVMYLRLNDKGKSVNLTDKKKSFASNIHHLLGDSFFFENNVYIGEFARNKIADIIEYINNDKSNKDTEYHYNLIELIDEPILKSKLTEMLFEKFPNFQRQKNIEKKEMMVKAYAKQMGIEIDIKNNNISN